MPATLADFKAEIARLERLHEIMSGVDPTLEAVYDAGGLAEMRALAGRAAKQFDVIAGEYADWPDRAMEVALAADALREPVWAVRDLRLKIQTWLGLADEGEDS